MSKQPQRRASDMSEKLIAKIIATRPKSKLLTTRKRINAFLRIYYANVPVEDLQDKSDSILARAAISHLEFGGTRKQGESRLRIFNPSEKYNGYDSQFTIVEMVNDNMPFLVDSVSAALNRHNLAAQMTVHPLLRVERDKRGKIKDISGLLWRRLQLSVRQRGRAGGGQRDCESCRLHTRP